MNARNVDCPECGARAGQFCRKRTFFGWQRMTNLHAIRKRAAAGQALRPRKRMRERLQA
jgi:hypothetical protein